MLYTRSFHAIPVGSNVIGLSSQKHRNLNTVRESIFLLVFILVYFHFHSKLGKALIAWLILIKKIIVFGKLLGIEYSTDSCITYKHTVHEYMNDKMNIKL